MSLNRKTPRTEKIKKNKSIKAPTFTREGKLKINVSISFYKPFILFTSFKSLVTLNTRTTLANYGPTLKKDKDCPPIKSMVISTMEEQTTKKSNLFHPSYK